MAAKRVPTGSLFVVEGPDGVGKTTLVAELTEQLSRASRPVQNFSFPGRTRGTLGEFVYRLHHELGTIDPTALQILHVAAHVDLITRIVRPLLSQGSDVVLDRYWWSTLVYSRITNCNMDVIQAALEAEARAWDGVAPALIVLLDRAEPFRAEHDTATFAALRSAYLEVARSSVHPVLQMSSDKAPTQLAHDILKGYFKS